jgi:lysophospholipase L1-like esterase
MKRFVKLLAVAIPVAWFQLPVMQERALSLSPISEALAQTTHDSLAGVTASIGKPVVALRSTTEDAKGMMEARVLAGPVPVTLLPQPAMPSNAPGTPVVAAPKTAGAAVLPASPATGGASNVHAGATLDVALAATGASSPTSTESAATAHDVFHQKKTIVLEGDSVMGEIAFSFQRFAAHHTAWTVINAHKVSSGLCNTEYYDWPKTAGDLAKQYHPDIVLLTMGPNDGQDIYLSGKRLKMGSDAWHAEYVSRFRSLVADASSTGAKVYWFSVPVMRDASLESKMVHIRDAQRDALSQMPQVTIIDETADFRDEDGHFIEKGKVDGKLRTLRAPDGVHLTAAGADILVNALADEMVKPAPIAAR